MPNKKPKRPNLMLQLTDEEDRGKPDLRETSKAASLLKGSDQDQEDKNFEESKIKPRKPLQNLV